MRTEAPPPIGSDPGRTVADWVRCRVNTAPEGALVLGSGWSPVAGKLSSTTSWSYENIPGMPSTSVEGHPGRLTIGTWSGIPVIAFEGRFHEYEGNADSDPTLPARIAHELGCDWFICTNASGGIAGIHMPGELVLVEDDLEIFPRGHDRPHPGTVYSHGLRTELVEAARQSGVGLSTGILAHMSGPNYETSAEVRMLRSAGATLVSMSTLPEARCAHALGMRVAAISCVTNTAQRIGGQPLRHRDVLEALQGAADKAGRFFETWLRTQADTSQSH